MKKLSQYFSGKRRTRLIALVTLLALLATTGVMSTLEVRVIPADNSTFAQGARGGNTTAPAATGDQADQDPHNGRSLPPVTTTDGDPPIDPGAGDDTDAHPGPPQIITKIEADTTDPAGCSESGWSFEITGIRDQRSAPSKIYVNWDD